MLQHLRFYVVSYLNKIIILFTFKGHQLHNLYDSIHLLKSNRNNLSNFKQFVFSLLDFIEFEDSIHDKAGEISRRFQSLLHNVNEKMSYYLLTLKKLLKYLPKLYI